MNNQHPHQLVEAVLTEDGEKYNPPSAKRSRPSGNGSKASSASVSVISTARLKQPQPSRRKSNDPESSDDGGTNNYYNAESVPADGDDDIESIDEGKFADGDSVSSADCIKPKRKSAKSAAQARQPPKCDSSDWLTYLESFAENGQCTLKDTSFEAMKHVVPKDDRNAQRLFETSVVLLVQALKKSIILAKQQTPAIPRAMLGVEVVNDLFAGVTTPAIMLAAFSFLSSCGSKKIKTTVARQCMALSLAIDISDQSETVDTHKRFNSCDDIRLAFQAELNPAVGTHGVDFPESAEVLLAKAADLINAKHSHELDHYLRRQATKPGAPVLMDQHCANSITFQMTGTRPIISQLLPWLVPGLMNVSGILGLRKVSSAGNYSALAKFLDYTHYMDTIYERFQDKSNFIHPNDLLRANSGTFHVAVYEPFIEEYLTIVFTKSTIVGQRAKLMDQITLEPYKTLKHVWAQLSSHLLGRSKVSEAQLVDERIYEVFITEKIPNVIKSVEGYLVQELNNCVFDVLGVPDNHYHLGRQMYQMSWSDRLSLIVDKAVTITLMTMTGEAIKKLRTSVTKSVYCVTSHNTEQGYVRCTHTLKRLRSAANSDSNV